MDAGTATVLAALISGFVALVGVILKFMVDNKKDHGRVMDVLHKIGGKLDKVDGRLTHHIDWHLQGGTDGRSTEGNTGSIQKTQS